MSYIQPENSNRVNLIKQKFESSPKSNSSMSEEKKEQLRRTLSASPVEPRKNLKLNVTRQLSNPGRNIKRSPAFRGDKSSRTKILNSPSKEKVLSLVDKNLKLFEDKQEYGKIGNVKKKILDTGNIVTNDVAILYDDVSSFARSSNSQNMRSEFNAKVQDSTAYTEMMNEDDGDSRSARSQSTDRSRIIQTTMKKGNECKDSVRTTVISRQRNISSIYGMGDELDSIRGILPSNVVPVEHDTTTHDIQNPVKLDKILKNGVEYTKVMKLKSNSFSGQIENDRSKGEVYENKGDMPDIREELSRRKYKSPSQLPEFASAKADSYGKIPYSSDKSQNISGALSGRDGNFVETKDNSATTKSSIAKDRRENLSRKSSSFSDIQEIIGVKLTDTLKAALKAPLPPGPPPKKPPRTFAHSPVTNRSPVDDYEEVDGFWQKKKVRGNELPVENVAPNTSDGCQQNMNSFLNSKREVLHNALSAAINTNPLEESGQSRSSFLHSTASKQLRRSLRDRNRRSGDESSKLFDQDIADVNKKPSRPVQRNRASRHEDLKAQNRDQQYIRRMPKSDKSPKSRRKVGENTQSFGENLENSSSEYEPIVTTTSDSNNSSLNKSTSSKLEIDEKLTKTDYFSGRNGCFSPADAINGSTSSEENSNSSMNLSYSPQKFKRSPIKTGNIVKCRASRDSEKMLERLENVLIQHQNALGPKVISPRTDRPEIGNGTNSRTESDCDSESDTSRNKDMFQKRLSRTLEHTKRLGPLPQIPVSPERKISPFDCLPTLNCASSSIYEQIQNPDCKFYLTDSKSSSMERSENIYIKSGDLPRKSHFYLDSSKNSLDFRDKENCGITMSPASKRLSTELKTFSDEKKRQSDTLKNQEHVYAEPFMFNKNSGTNILGYGKLSPRINRCFERCKQERDLKNIEGDSQLHYMCTPIPSAIVETNNNNSENELTNSKNRQEKVNARRPLLKLTNLARPPSDKFDKIKIGELLDHAFGQPVMTGIETPTDSNTSSDTDSLASTLSISDEFLTFNEKLQLFKGKEQTLRQTKTELRRNLTERRKHYVRRVSSRYSEKRESLLTDTRVKLFDVCLLVELNLITKKPYVKDKYPIHANAPEWIENFCFPDALDWPPSDSDQNQSYSVVLTDEKGNRRFGYCRRVKPEGTPVCLPLAYCLITKHRASGFYFKVLHELESRHGLPDLEKRTFIEEVYKSDMPQPGQALTIKTRFNTASNEASTDADYSANNNIVTKEFTNSHGKSCNTTSTSESNSKFINSERSNADKLMATFKDLDIKDEVIIRLDDHRLEERDMSQLFDAVSIKVLLVLFGSLLLERKVVLVCIKLSKLSSCVEALQSLLYPLSWPHTFIPVLPNIPGLPEILQAPLPFVIGILKPRNSVCVEVTTLEDGIVVDLDTSKITCSVGDESSILPSRLQKGLKAALNIVSNNTKSGDGVRNFLVSEAFLRVFVETCAHCNNHIVTQQDGKIVFEKDSFVKALPSKNMQCFLEWFVETTMFNQFLHDRILRLQGITSSGEDNMKLFDLRVAETSKAAGKNAQTKKGFVKKKTFGDRLKDFTPFN